MVDLHIRKQVRDAVKALLTGLPTTQGRVETGRTRPLGEKHQPTLLIYTPDELAGRAMEGNPANVGRDIQLIIDGRTVTRDPPDDLLDVIALEVEGVLQGRNLDELVFDVELTRTASDVRAEGEHHIGAIRMEFRVRCWQPDEEE